MKKQTVSEEHRNGGYLPGLSNANACSIESLRVDSVVNAESGTEKESDRNNGLTSVQVLHNGLEGSRLIYFLYFANTMGWQKLSRWFKCKMKPD